MSQKSLKLSQWLAFAASQCDPSHFCSLASQEQWHRFCPEIMEIKSRFCVTKRTAEKSEFVPNKALMTSTANLYQCEVNYLYWDMHQQDCLPMQLQLHGFSKLTHGAFPELAWTSVGWPQSILLGCQAVSQSSFNGMLWKNQKEGPLLLQ